MKITYIGRTQNERVIGTEMRCYNCGTVGEIEKGDLYIFHTATSQLDEDSITSDCPVCKRTMVGYPKPKRIIWNEKKES